MLYHGNSYVFYEVANDLPPRKISTNSREIGLALKSFV